MTRPTLRRTPVLERLETRQVLSSVAGLSADKQYVLEMINLVRTSPKSAADRITAHISSGVQTTLDHYGLTVDGLKAKLASATPLPPVAYNAALDSAAQAQSQYQADHGIQTHQGPGELGMADRFAAAGYTPPLTEGENTYAFAESADQAMQSFLFDWGVADGGHYRNLLQPGTSPQDSYKDVGIGLVNTTKGVGPLVLTQDFGSQQNEGPQILGVSYDDPNHTGFYAPGEGKGGLTIDAVNLATQVKYETQTSNSGGYQVPVAPNADYQVTAIQGGTVVQSQTVHVGDVNEKVDFILDGAQVAAQTLVQDPPSQTPVADQAVVVQDDSKQTATSDNSVAKVEAVKQDPTPIPIPTPSPTPSQPATPPTWLSKWSRWKAINGAGQG